MTKTMPISMISRRTKYRAKVPPTAPSWTLVNTGGTHEYRWANSGWDVGGYEYRGRVKRVVVAGGIGAGKSAVCERLVALGWPVIDADVIARRVVEKGEP